MTSGRLFNWFLFLFLDQMKVFFSSWKLPSYDVVVVVVVVVGGVGVGVGVVAVVNVVVDRETRYDESAFFRSEIELVRKTW